jgi:hypothetical protein
MLSPDLVASVAPAVTRLLAEVQIFCSAPTRTGGPELAADLPCLRHAMDLLEVKFSESAAAFAATDEYDEEGAASPIHWIRNHCHMGSGAVADRIAVGELARELPASVEATADGQIGFAHLALIARTATAIAQSGSREKLNESPLLEKAREFSVGRFRDFCDHARHAADMAAYVLGEVRAVEDRTLDIRPGESGMVFLRGRLDPEGGAIVRSALEALACPTGKHDDRKRERRLADALIELSSHAMDTGRLPQRGSQRTHLQVTASLETMLQRCGAPAADVEFSIPLSAKAVERLACDCSFTRILLGQDSAVIDVGRATRKVSGPTRKALNARDKGCRWPGCERRASWTESHHILHWIRDGGPSDVPNLVLLCYRHHWMVHEGGWQLVKADGAYTTVPPPFRGYSPRVRGPGPD